MKIPDIVGAGRQGYIFAKRNQPGLKKYFHKKRMTMHLKIILFNADPTKQDIILSQRPLNLCHQVQKVWGSFSRFVLIKITAII